MEVLKDKSYRTYDKLSRYANFPYYYNTLDNKYVYATTAQLSENTPYTSYRVQRYDTYDSLALDFYNNPTYYWIICDFNRIQDPFIRPKEGTILKIPTLSTIQYGNLR